MDLKDVRTDELVDRFGDEYEKYWELSNSLALRASKKAKDRKDLYQKGICIDIESEIRWPDGGQCAGRPRCRSSRQGLSGTSAANAAPRR